MTAVTSDSARQSAAENTQVETEVGFIQGYYEKVSSKVHFIWNRVCVSLQFFYEQAKGFFSANKNSFLERVFRTSYFRIAAISDGFIERSAYRLYLSMSEGTCSPSVFEEKRAERSLALFKAIGTTTSHVTPKDGTASIHMMNLKAKGFERILQEHGAKWERKELKTSEGKSYIAFVIVPNPLSTSWKAFAEDVLIKFNWKQEDLIQANGEKISGIVTSENADLVPESGNPKVFFFHHSPSSSFIHERNRAAYYLGMKQDVCMYDSRGIWKSSGSPLEAGFYLDAEKVFEELLHKHGYALKDMWVGGKCSGAHVAAHIKAKYHDQGINFFAEGSFSNVRRDFVSSLDPISRFLYGKCVNALTSSLS